MLDGRPVRFGYNPLEFPDFSWRGYAQMSPIQVGTHPLPLTFSMAPYANDLVGYYNIFKKTLVNNSSIVLVHRLQSIDFTTDHYIS